MLSDGHIQARIDSNIRITSNTANRAAEEQSSSQFDSGIASGGFLHAVLFVLHHRDDCRAEIWLALSSP
jgi:hypothetical protein